MTKKKTGRLFLIITYVVIGCLLLGYTTYCLVSCSHDKTLYTLTCLSSNPAYGEVAIIGQDQYAMNDDVHVASHAADGYELENWTINGEVVGTDPDISFKMPAGDTEIVANFIPLKFNVFVGSDPAMVTITGDGKHDFNEEVTLSAEVKEGYKFISWYNNTEGEYIYEPSFTFLMPKKDLNFSISTYPVYCTVHMTGDENFFNGFNVYDFYGYYNTNVTIYFNKRNTTLAKHISIEGVYNYENETIGELIHAGGDTFSVKMPAHDLYFYVKTIYTE